MLKRKSLRSPILGALGLLAAAVTTQADYPTTIQSDGPVGYWRFNDGPVVTPTTPVGVAAVNLGTAGPSCDGTYLGTFAGVPGAIAGNGAVTFYNASQAVGTQNGSVDVLPNAAINPSGPFTVEFWTRPNAITADLFSPFNSMSFSPGRAGWLFYQNGATWQYRLGNNGSTTASAVNGGAIVAGQWQHVVGTYTGGTNNGTMTLYVDGVQVASGPVPLFEPNSNASLRIGRTSGPNREYDGAVDEVAVYTNVLSAGTIAAHYSARTTNAANYATQVLLEAPVGFWRLNDLSQNPVVANSSAAGSSLAGLYNYWSSTTPGLPGPTYPGFEAGNTVLQTGSGTNGFASLPPLYLNANTVTMECWLKRIGAQVSYAGVLFHRGGGGTATGIMFRDLSNELGYHWSDQYYNWISGLTPPDGIWTYVALAVSPDQAVLYMYDGTTWSAATNVATHAVQAFRATTRVATDAGDSRFLNGQVDEVAIYNKTLSEGQLRTHALAGFGGSATAPVLVSDPPTVSPVGAIYTTTPFSITVDAYGVPPLTYQWKHAGTNLPGATASSFNRAAAVASDAGEYLVVVGNAYGSVTSLPVTIAINPAVPPTITTQPASRLVYAGGNASFTVAADGTTPMTYQWKHAGTNLPAATNATLLVTNCAAAEAGAYTVGVTNVAGGVLSSTATLTLSAPTAGTFAEKVVTNGPLAYWRLNESGGTIAYDYAGGNDGTAIGAATPASAFGLSSPTYPGMEAGNVGYAFDGTSGAVLVGNPARLNFTGQITMMAWVRPNATDGLRNILCHGYQTSPNSAELGLRINAGSYQAWTWGGGDFTATAPVPAEDIGNWVFIVGTYDGTAWHLYRNGVEISSTSGTTGAIVVSDVGWAIGARGTGTERFHQGDIDEVAIYNKALSSAEIYAMYASAAYGSTTPPTIVRDIASHAFYAGVNVYLSVDATGSLPLNYQWQHAGTNLPGATTASLTLANFNVTQAGSYQVTVNNGAGIKVGTLANLTIITPAAGTFEATVVGNSPVAYWRLGESSGTIAYDYAGAYDGTYNGVLQGQPGAILGDANGAAVFDGAASFVGTGRPMLNNRAQFTVMGWLKRGAIHSTRGGYFGQNDLLEFGDAGSGASVEAWINATGGNIVVPWPWADDQWGFIVLTGNGTQNTLYIDGVLAGTRNATVANYGFSAFNFNIGGGGIFNTTGDFFNGSIDDVAVFDKPLSAATIAALYSAGLYGNTTPPFLTRDVPPSTVAPVGTTVSLSAGVNGTQPISYQWKKDGSIVPGATSATLTLPNAYFTDAGSYVLWATNALGYTNTAAAIVSILPPPSYANQTNDLVVHLRFDGNYVDSSGRLNDALPANGSPGFVTGRVGQGVHIATTPGNNYLFIQDVWGDLLFDVTNSFTVGFWIKYTGAFNDVPIIGNAVNSTYQLGWVFTDSAVPGRLEWSLVSTANSGTYLRDPVGTAVIGNGSWHHVLGVVDRQQQMAYAYVDGALAGSFSVAGLGTLITPNAVTIGTDPTGNYGPSATFDMDDLGIWRRALTAVDAAGIYAAGQTGASFDVTTPVKVYVNQVGSNVDISWQGGTLRQSSTVNGTYNPVPGATAPFYRTTASGSAMFFKVGN